MCIRLALRVRAAIPHVTAIRACSRAAITLACGIVLLNNGVATAWSDPVEMPIRQQQYVSEDGWVLSLNMTNEVIDHIDNLAGASNSWQARVSYRAEATIAGEGSSVVQDATMESGYFVGCRTDSSQGVSLEGHASLGLSQGADVDYFGSNNTGAIISNGANGPQVTPINTNTNDIGVTGKLGASQGIGGGISVPLLPGGLSQLTMSSINFRNMHAVANVRAINVEADGCGGQVKIQSYATFKIRTRKGNDSQTLYGEPKDL